ncbi:MAG TPA: GNAT family N-acetyltransferase [Burkholderiales bacterium]|jgi:predicted GNAT family acetyltransferase
MDAIRIDRQDYRARGTYVATIPGVHGIARLNYKRERDDLLIAEHTETSESLQHKGVALALIQRMVEDARAEGFKIYALCSYVEDERRVHPEWADVFRVPST